MALPDPHYHAEFYADVPMKRLLAWVIDSGAILVLTILAIPFTAFTALFFLPLFYMAIGFAYRVITLARRSATPGMRLMSIEVRTEQGGRLDLGQATMHTLLYSLFLSFFLPMLASVVLIMTGARGQGLHDLALGTVVINRAARH